MNCPSCGSVCEDGKPFCRKCGNRLQTAVPGETSAGKIIAAKRREFDSRLSTNPDDVNTLLEYGEYLLSVALAGDAIPVFLKAVSLKKDSPDIRRRLIAAYRAKNDWPAAAAQLKELLRLAPNAPGVYEELADGYEAAGDLKEAVEAIGALLIQQPDQVGFLVRQRSLLQRLNDREGVVAICRRLIELNPTDKTSLKVLVQNLRASGKMEEANGLIEQLLAADENDPQANLLVGIVKHNNTLSAGGQDWPSVIALLERATAGIDALNETEENLASLYYASALLHAETRDAAIAKTLMTVRVDTLDKQGASLLSWCLAKSGDVECGAKRIDAAIDLYERSLSIERNPETAQKLGIVYRQRADVLDAAGNSAAALAAYRKAAEFLPDDGAVATKLRQTSTIVKRRRRLVIGIACVAASIGGLLALFVYLGEGAFEITVDPTADRIVLYRRGTEIAIRSQAEKILTGTVRLGRYVLKAEKEGYAPIQQTIWGPFGRTQKALSFSFKPMLGAVKADSDPQGATITVRTKQGEKTGVTPCNITDVAALPAQIEVSLPECNPIKLERSIEEGKTLDLGIIRFTGGLKVDSNPMGAEVRIGNELKGVTPIQVDGLLAKRTTVEIRKENAGIFLANLNIEPEKITDLGTVTLSNLGSLQADSIPQGAKVYVDNKDVGVTPLSLNNVEVGNRVVRVESAGCVPYEKAVTIESGQVTNLGMISFTGGLKVDSDPPGAEVYVDGDRKGIVPLTIDALPAREVSLELRIPGKGALARSVRVKPAQVTDLGILKVRGFSGEWTGTVGSGKDAFLLYLKESEDGRLSGAGRMQGWDYWEVFNGTSSGTSAKMTCTEAIGFSRYAGNIRYYSLTFSLSLGADGSTLEGKVSGGNDDGACLLTRTESGAYSCQLNPDMRYIVQVGNSTGLGYLYVNGRLVSIAPEGKKTAPIDISPWMQEGTNRLRYTNNHPGSRRWISTFSAKRIRADQTEETLVNTEEDGSTNKEELLRRHLVLPYFETTHDLQTWQDRFGTDRYLDEVILNPATITASSQFGSDYLPENAFDHKTNTAWISASESIEGAWIKLDLGPDVIVDGFRLFSKSEESGDRFARVKKATIELDGKQIPWDLSDNDIEQFLLTDKTATSSARLRVDEVYPGNKFNAVAIAEFQAVQFVLPEAPPSDTQGAAPPANDPTQENDESTPSSARTDQTGDSTGQSLPLLQSPGVPTAPGVSISTGTPTFEWQSEAAFDSFGFYISRAPYGESNLVYRNKGIAGSARSFSLNEGDALPDGSYRWNLEAFRNGASLGYAKCLYFEVNR